ncbi:hypothetical protein K458DRAFT_384426 [Lentithecium fluviatile CBS 122367]|uniref:Uncharacterized protein n=1 Tax=Lentithecium fluviatile CBS 122367 TaxID=1168545 RepID=A0A6G1JHS3_9PLEO|nr:hypothetical protein K458DRAFT_384426 [Lentithecium fluviatile CBS 122367]
MSTQCTFPTPLNIPTPPTTSQTCAVPIGGSNTTLLDTCCNGHINPVLTYSAPGSSDNCYSYCTTDDAVSVQECLGEYMMEGAFRCFGVVAARAEGSAGGFGVGSGNGRGAGAWWVKVVVGVGVLGALGGLV